jgi:vacuolar iron transporter family protein
MSADHPIDPRAIDPDELEHLALDEVSRAAHFDHHHRSVSSGGARAAVFGASDGLVSNVALILGVAAADPAEGVVRLAGIAGLVAGAVSMAAGEYISMRSQAELYERELRIERVAQRDNPELERLELAKIYEHRGMEPELAMDLAEAMMRDPEVALEVHAREELGIDPDELGSPIGAAVWSFAAFAIGAILPLVPWMFTGGDGAVVGSIAFTAVGALVLGALVGALSGRNVAYPAGRQRGIAAAAAAVTYGIGSAVGVGV